MAAENLNNGVGGELYVGEEFNCRPDGYCQEEAKMDANMHEDDKPYAANPTEIRGILAMNVNIGTLSSEKGINLAERMKDKLLGDLEKANKKLPDDIAIFLLPVRASSSDINFISLESGFTE